MDPISGTPVRLFLRNMIRDQPHNKDCVPFGLEVGRGLNATMHCLWACKATAVTLYTADGYRDSDSEIPPAD